MTDLKPCPFDPSVEDNWHFHDEYDFWYIGFPEILKPDPQYKIDLARERSFRPWEEYIKYTRANNQPDDVVMKRGELRTVIEAVRPFAHALVNAEEVTTQGIKHRASHVIRATTFWLSFNDFVRAVEALSILETALEKG